MSDQLLKIAESSLTKFEGKIPPEEFLQFLRESVAVEDLLQSRKAQAAIARIMDDYFSRDKLKIVNPYPVLELKTSSTTSFVHTAFMLKDQKNYYYFPSWNPGDGISTYLRPEDVVSSKTFSQTFSPETKVEIMKSLHINEQQFNYLVYTQDPRVTKYAVAQDIPFNKPFCKVAIGGGKAELYNYRAQLWEINGDGKYSPSFKQKIMSQLIK